MLFAPLKISKLLISNTWSGHRYLEADAMHSTIEGARRHLSTYTTREWELVIRAACKRPKLFIVSVLNHTDFIDVKQLAKEFLRNIKQDH